MLSSFLADSCRKCTRSTRRWRACARSCARRRTLSNTCCARRRRSSRTSLSRTTRSTSTARSAWACARPSPCHRESRPSRAGSTRQAAPAAALPTYLPQEVASTTPSVAVRSDDFCLKKLNSGDCKSDETLTLGAANALLLS